MFGLRLLSILEYIKILFLYYCTNPVVSYLQATSVDRRGVSELFAECLFDFIGVSGMTLEHHFPGDYDTLFGYITEKILSNDVSRYDARHFHR